MSSETLQFIASVRINENGDDHICRHCERFDRTEVETNTLDHANKTQEANKSQKKRIQECIETSANTTGSTTTSSAPQ